MNNVTVWDTGTSGNNSLVDTGGDIYNSKNLKGYEFIFKTDSVVRCSHLGGETAVFGWHTVMQSDGLIAPHLVEVLNEIIIFVGLHNIYQFDGAGAAYFGHEVKDAVFAALDYSSGQYHKRSHIINIKKKDLLGIFIPEASAYPDAAWLWNYVNNTWTHWDFGTANITAGCSFNGLNGTNVESGTAFGDSSGNLYEFDFDSENDNETAIDANWDSKDFSMPDDPGAPPEYTHWTGVYIKGLGDGLTVYYSIDHGENWVEVSTIAFNSTTYESIEFADFDIESQYLRFRIANGETSETFGVSKYWVGYEKGAVT